MTDVTTAQSLREPGLLGQTVVVIGATHDALDKQLS